ncbi:serine hydrolase FSH [Pyrenochaeta sp. MPI-SDFR-AT-0127]|nr:serine hydrolase FSH [Pyrenochaeta sp. MPI-SDFR-AT-0127]
MRFLCLHGRGTNGQILEAQTAAVRIELGDNHIFEYVDGCSPAELDPELAAFFPPNEDYYDYWGDSMESKIKAVTDLERMLEEEGPFDGVLAFSQGAMLAMTYILREAKLHPTKHHMDPAFKFAILFSAVQPVDSVHLEETGVEAFVDSNSDHPLVRIPTAHIWGRGDKTWSKGSKEVASLCDPLKRAIYIHDGGHEIPGSKDNNNLYGVVHTVRRTIDAVSHAVAA